MHNLILFVPPELAMVLFVGAGLAFVVGARAFAGTLIVAALAILFLPVILAPIFDALPTWGLLLLFLFFGLGLVRAVFNLLLGKSSTDHMVGILAADTVRFALLTPFRVMAWIVRAIWRPM